MEVINAGMRRGIKVMCVTCQTAQFISLIPKPKDFVVRIVGDVVYLSSQIQKLSEDMNKLLDSYAEIPGNYLMTQMNSITGSLTGITNRLSTFAQNGVNETIGLGENALGMISELTGSVIDTTGELTGAIVGLGSAVAETGTIILGENEISETIHDATEVVLEWTSDGFKEISSNATAPIKKATEKLTNVKTNITNKINDTTNAVNNKIEEAQKMVETLITELRKKMEDLSNKMDSGFKDVTGLSSIAKGANSLNEAIKESDEKNGLAAQAASAITESLASVIKNFSIGKVVTAFAGVLAQSVIVRLGLDKLPPIDFESMMCKIRDDMTISTQDLYKQYNTLTENAYNDYIKFGEDSINIPSDDRDYSAKNYEEFLNQFSDEQKAQRDAIRTLMKNNYDDRGNVKYSNVDTLTRREIKSAIKEVEKYRKKVKNAKQASTLKDIIGEELDRFKKEAEYKCNSLKSDWKDMMQQYKDCIKEIKEFFQIGGPCDMFIDDCCDAINKDFDDIKELCKSLISQLIGCVIKVGMPADIGTGVPNPVYKIADFWLDIKTIFKFIKDIITLIIDIINNINKLARLMLNGLNSLKEIISQLMEMLGLKWLMDLVQSIINLFGGNIRDSRIRLINTLSPIYYSETVEYENALEALEKFLENDNKFDDGGEQYFNTAISSLEALGAKKKDIKNLKELGEDILEDFEELGENIVVAYKSPIIPETENDATVDDLTKGGSMSDIQFIGWHFYHPNLNHTKNKYYSDGLIDKIIKKIKGKIIKRASKNGHKKHGGVNMLRSRTVGSKKTKIDEAYVAFYWYTYYTEDLEKDCFEMTIDDNTTIVDNIVKTENGSVVEITDVNGEKRKVFVADNMVKKGDYVVVEGVKYRVNG